MLQVGSVLDGKYKILNEIGHGGMSVVYLALNERANKTWAVKEVRKNGGNDNEIVSQGLVAETEMLKKLNHPNLPSIVDVIDTQDSFIIVMDYIEGKSLQSLITHEGPQSVEKVVTWSKQLTNVLGYLHNRRPPIIYRDMKPANVMLKPNGEDVVLIDFGTAREYKETKQGDTTWLGTRGYAAPEQFGGRGQTDARTDIYNLGATMYHLLTGYSPADTQFVIYPLGQLRPELGGTGIEKIVSKCCQPDPAHRYQSCEELMYALDHYQEIDEATIRTRNRKWYLFLTSIAVCVLGIIGMITFKMMENNARAETYGSFIQQAESEADISEAAKLYKQAMDLKPGQADAYESIVKKIMFDSEISEDEVMALNTCLNSTAKRNNQNDTNLVVFERNNDEGYAKLMYDLALGYYTSYKGGYEKANQYINSALKYSDCLDETQNKHMQSLEKITAFTAKMEKAGDKEVDQGLNDDYTYLDFFVSFEDYLNDPDGLDELTGNKQLSLALCREAESRIVSRYIQFTTNGVTLDDMMQLHNNIGRYLHEILGSQTADSSSTVGRLYQEADTAYWNANGILESKGNRPKEQGGN